MTSLTGLHTRAGMYKFPHFAQLAERLQILRRGDGTVHVHDHDAEITVRARSNGSAIGWSMPSTMTLPPFRMTQSAMSRSSDGVISAASGRATRAARTTPHKIRGESMPFCLLSSGGTATRESRSRGGSPWETNPSPAFKTSSATCQVEVADRPGNSCCNARAPAYPCCPRSTQ